MTLQETSDPAVSIRTADQSDVAAIHDLVHTAYRDPDNAGWTTEAHLLGGQRTDAAEIRAAVEDPAGCILVAVAGDGAITGCCRLEDRGTHAYFGMFAVRPALQGSGLGNRLLEAAEARAVGVLGVAEMQLTVIEQRTDLISWYQRRGYRATGQYQDFPYGDARFGLPRRGDLRFVVLQKALIQRCE